MQGGKADGPASGAAEATASAQEPQQQQQAQLGERKQEAADGDASPAAASLDHFLSQPQDAGEVTRGNDVPELLESVYCRTGNSFFGRGGNGCSAQFLRRQQELSYCSWPACVTSCQTSRCLPWVARLLQEGSGPGVLTQIPATQPSTQQDSQQPGAEGSPGAAFRLMPSSEYDPAHPGTRYFMKVNSMSKVLLCSLPCRWCCWSAAPTQNHFGKKLLWQSCHDIKLCRESWSGRCRSFVGGI